MPKKRIPNSTLVKDLLRRVDGLERKWTDSPPHESVSSSAQTPNSPELLAVSPVQDTSVSNSDDPFPKSEELSIQDRRNMLAIFFSHVHGNPYVFVHEGTIRSQVLNYKAPDVFIYALCAICAW
jgi:hypothetical protein